MENIYKIKKTEKDGGICAVIKSEDIVISDVQSALDLLMTANYETGSKNIVISKDAITEEFFKLSTGLAGEVLQKFVNYGGKLAIYGDFSAYTSKPLRDFIRESNEGKDFFFADSEEAALEMMIQNQSPTVSTYT